MQNFSAAHTEGYSAGRLKFDMPRKMKVDDNPFPGDQNMVDARLLKGKTKVLTSIKSRVARTVNPERQISADEIQGN